MDVERARRDFTSREREANNALRAQAAAAAAKRQTPLALSDDLRTSVRRIGNGVLTKAQVTPPKAFDSILQNLSEKHASSADWRNVLDLQLSAFRTADSLIARTQEADPDPLVNLGDLKAFVTLTLQSVLFGFGRVRMETFGQALNLACAQATPSPQPPAPQTQAPVDGAPSEKSTSGAGMAD